MPMLIQKISARIGMATGRSLAANIREKFPGPVVGLRGPKNFSIKNRYIHNSAAFLFKNFIWV
jgi:hypothetical protein